MKVSVVIPAYNEEKYIGNCLLSLKNQEQKADEIIVVDNNSTDHTGVIASEYHVNLVHETKQGMIPARNSGYNKASYDIIARTDADTVLPSDWIKKIKNNFEESDIDALSGPIVFYDLPLKTPFWANLFLDFMTHVQKGRNTLIGPNMAFTKNIWGKIRDSVCLDSKAVHEDVDIGMHILQAGGTIKIDKTLIVEASGRRIKANPVSFFIEYPVRLIHSLQNHPL